MSDSTYRTMVRGSRLGLAVLGGLALVAAVLLAVSGNSPVVYADPIPPEEGGYPKLSLSFKTVTPTLAHVGGTALYYAVEILNTGAYTATGVTLTDDIPQGTTYNDDAQSSVDPQPTFAGGTLTWAGEVGFDAAVVVSFSVTVPPAFVGTVRNAAVINHPLIARPVTVTAETVVTDQPILTIGKTAVPAKPGANKPLTYTLVVTNGGQPAVDLPITVTDRVPLDTTSPDPGVDGFTDGDVVTWTRRITLELGETTEFTFSVIVGDVLSGTVITNDDYRVTSLETGMAVGELYTVTVVDPIFLLSKHVWPDPPGSNREMTYTLTLLNVGSLATNLVITDRVPAGVTYQRPGTPVGGIISWMLSRLDTDQSERFTYTVYISDVMEVPIVNDEYGVCCDEVDCQAGDVLTSVVKGPTFETFAMLDPLVRKPGGGSLTITLGVRNLGPGNALDARAVLMYRNISMQEGYLIHPGVGSLFSEIKDDPNCTSHCKAFEWWGPIGAGEIITFATTDAPSTQVGSEGNTYTATVVITDNLSNMNTTPVTGTAIGKITHLANLIPTKSALPVVGRGQLLTYTIHVWNSALGTDEPPNPWLLDVVPVSTTVVYVSGGGVTQTLTDTTVISWTLPPMSTGDELSYSFTVRVDNDLVSGTQIVNNDYHAYWFEVEDSAIFSNTGQPVTTTVQEVGLIDSYKTVTPTVAWPGPGNVLTYYLHIVNSSGIDLTGNKVTVYDRSPWQHSTYQRDAVASAGTVISDIVSVQWRGDVAAFSSEIVTFTVLVDPDFQGPITNTAVINHPDLLNEVEVQAVAYITEEPVLRITKSASPDPVEKGGELAYTIRVVNLGQQATSLVITDTVPADTVYVPDSATANGELVDDQVRWQVPVLEPGESRTFSFQVTVGGGREVINEQYAVRCAEGVVGLGAPVVTRIVGGGNWIYLPIVLRNSP